MLADSLPPIPFWAEAVNTACYVQNRVLVTKPHNKTPYELLHSRTPSIGFIRPFACPVTILNTLDSLSKFDGKVDKGFLVGYSNTDGDAAFDEKKHEFDEKKTESEFNVSPSSKFEDYSKDNINEVNVVGTLAPTVGQISPNSTNTFSAVGPLNAAASPTHRKSSFIDASQLPNDPDMPELEDIAYSDDEDDVGAETDFNNLETSITEELLQFKMQKIWVLVDLPYGKRVIGTKWVFRNKKDERGIVVKNKARLVAQGHTQEEGIDYKEVFAPEEVYICQPLVFEDPDHPDKVYKVVKALYGLHQAPRAWKFGLTDGKLASTLIDTKKPLLKDPDGEDVDVHIYRSMIGSLMYLPSLRPDIMFAVCACVRFQVTPKASHQHAVKRIFRYLKGKPHLGLWYPKDSPFDLVAYSDIDYAGGSLDKKSTTGGCQFLGCRLISWQCKKQIVVATSSTEAEYVGAAS
nr:uncharacterized mitochondrial protein AtMg00810-like [Tanacetum cinerariifolium]